MQDYFSLYCLSLYCLSPLLSFPAFAQLSNKRLSLQVQEEEAAGPQTAVAQRVQAAEHTLFCIPFVATVFTPTRRTTSPSRPPSLRQTRLPSLGLL